MIYIASMFDHCLYFNTASLARQLESEWAQAFKPFDLTPPQAFLLRAVLDRPGLTQCEFADAMTISRPTATRALDGLKEKGLIERRSTERDGREQAIYPTAPAIAMHASLNEASVQVSKRLKKLLGPDVFADTVTKIRDVRSALK
ncbi:MarR family transcriptional regulator [Sideroxydans sp. CL21]|uniref:MarR family winged helix-turn-helix transcriptional regulator n=1 Tax=Sideroxydans sp. CL21 TaxID=2600596 RepID=UPI0024BCAE07|nr:MarR family transcriptional regulator [Sideroxydans sp. CL21]